MKPIRNFVEYELNVFRQECNFSPEELEYFNYKAKDYSSIRISTEMNVSISTVYRLSKSVENKMEKVSRRYFE